MPSFVFPSAVTAACKRPATRRSEMTSIQGDFSASSSTPERAQSIYIYNAAEVCVRGTRGARTYLLCKLSVVCGRCVFLPLGLNQRWVQESTQLLLTGGGGIVNRTCGAHENLDNSLFLLQIFGPIYCAPL